jgi:hypothetical protein
MPKVSVSYVRLGQQSDVILTFENKAQKEECESLLQHGVLKDELRPEHVSELKVDADKSIVIAVTYKSTRVVNPKGFTLQETFDYCKTLLTQNQYTLEYHPSCEKTLVKQFDDAALEIWLQTRKRLIAIHKELTDKVPLKDIWSGVIAHATNATKAVESEEWKKANVVKKSELLSHAIAQLHCAQKLISEKMLTFVRKTTNQEDLDLAIILLEDDNCYMTLTENFSEFLGLNRMVFNQFANAPAEIKSVSDSTTFLTRMLGVLSYTKTKMQDDDVVLNTALSGAFCVFSREFYDAKTKIEHHAKSTDDEKKAAMLILSKMCEDPNFQLEENKPNKDLYLILRDVKDEVQADFALLQSSTQLIMNDASSDETLKPTLVKADAAQVNLLRVK